VVLVPKAPDSSCHAYKIGHIKNNREKLPVVAIFDIGTLLIARWTLFQALWKVHTAIFQLLMASTTQDNA
jgi:hypothetical protein